MRILIVGAGIGGMTLAALLDRRGVRATVIDRAPSTSHAGYMLGLYALGHRVLYGLGLHEQFAAASVECKHYASYDDHGDRIAQWSLDPISGRYGPLLSCTRPQLVELLRGGMGGSVVRFGTHPTAILPEGEQVRVTLSDGAEEVYDLVVGADGIGSSVRRLVFGEQPRTDTGWGGWVWWAPTDRCPPDTFVEFWGAGRFVGGYPTKDGVGVFAGAPVADGFADVAGRRERLRARFAGMGPLAGSWLDAVPDDSAEIFFWHLADVRSAEWVKGRVVLLGDAAAGFLPTAGVGASMAMESAAVLADELSRTDARYAEHALALYVKRRRRRVEAIQDDSRRLARLMFVSSAPIAAIRNHVSAYMSLEMAMGAITRAFEEPI